MSIELLTLPAVDRSDPNSVRLNQIATDINFKRLGSAVSTFANPTASVGLVAVNGVAATAMRSDAAPALDVSISPVWTGTHTFNNPVNGVVGFRYNNTAPSGQYLRGNGTNFVASAVVDADLPGTIVRTSRALNTTAPLTGGGDLSADRTISISANGISDTLLRQSNGLAIIGRASNSIGNVADIIAGTDAHVLRRSGTTLGFGTIGDASITALAFSKLTSLPTTLAGYGITDAQPLDTDLTEIAGIGNLRGDLLITNATANWARLNIGANGTFLKSNGTDPAWSTIASGDLPGSFSGFGNPTASIGLAAVNGVATTAMRSDAAPALDVSISPTWTGTHIFNNPVNGVSGFRYNNTAPSGQFLRGNGTNFVAGAIAAGDLPGSFSGFANPSATIGLAAVNGTATTAMRSDAAPALNQGITPTWTGAHTFSNAINGLSIALSGGSPFFTCAGPVGLMAGGAVSSIAVNLVWAGNNGSSINQGIVSQVTGANVASMEVRAIQAQANSAAAVHTASALSGLYVKTPVKGAGSTITSTYGIYVESQSGATNNYALKTNSGVVEFGDIVRIGGAAALDNLFLINPASVPNTSNSISGIRVQYTAAASHTSEVIGLTVTANGAGSTAITNAYGIQIGAIAAGASGSITNNYGLWIGDVTSGTNKYAIKTGLGAISLGDNITLTKNASGSFSFIDVINTATSANSSSFVECDIAGTNTGCSAGFATYNTVTTNGWSLEQRSDNSDLFIITNSNGFTPFTATMGANISLLTSYSSYGGGQRVIAIGNCNTVPTSSISGGGLLYVDNGALKWRGPSGTVTTMAPA